MTGFIINRDYHYESCLQEGYKLSKKLQWMFLNVWPSRAVLTSGH